MKRVLHIIDHLGLGGAQSVLVDLVTLINRKEWHCEVAVMHGRGVFREILERHDITVHELSASRWPPHYIPALVKLQENFDLLHFHLSGANWIAKPLAAIAGEQPRIAHDHASADLRFRGLGSLFMDAHMHRFSSHTIAVSPEVKIFLTHYEALPEESVTVIANGINTEIFRPSTLDEKEEARLFFGLNKRDFIIGSVGRLALEKNQTLFLQAAAQALAQGLSATYLLAGTGPQEERLQNLVAELGIKDHVRFLGHVEDRVRLYRALDLFVLTSHYEGLPMALLEAMASGVPVVSTDLAGIHHALEGGRHGILIPPGDLEALTQCLLHDNNTKFQQSALSARQKIETDFSAQHAVKKLEKLYESLVLNKRAVF